MTLLALILCLLPTPSTVRSVDICELNTICTCDGKPQAAYLLWWDFQDDDFHIVDWRAASAAPLPLAGRQSWFDQQTKKLITVQSRQFQEWHSTYDRERKDLEVWPMERRRKL